ncbi:MAG: type II toxin-antitoxin system RelE/ParE family toxin [Flavobacterium sp.]
MIFRYIYRPFAKIDLKEAVKYYKAISPSLAKDFLLRIREAKKFISLSPYGDDIVYKNIRIHNLKQFPYQIHYYIDENKKQIVILAIIFSKRKNLDFSDR